MANRHTLHLNHLPEFERWLQKNGWTLQETKGYFEVLRAVKPGRPHPLIVYKRMNARQHCSALDRDTPLVRQFLKERGTP